MGGAHPNGRQHRYAAAHAAELWAEFLPAMHGTDVGRWLYGSSGAGDRPPDIGHWVGYEIAKAFHARAADERDALRTLLRADAPERVWRESGLADPRP